MNSSRPDLSCFLRPERIERLKAVVRNRTRSVTLLLESVELGHNQSAVLRSCDSFGLQDVHIVQQKSEFCPNSRITQGCEKWLDLHFYDRVEQALSVLQERGFTILGSYLSPTARPLGELDLTGPIAFLFGNEKQGLPPELASRCAETFVIPMLGFSQSFNISVAASLTLYETVRQRVSHWGQHGDLSPEEQEALLQEFIRLSRLGTNRYYGPHSVIARKRPKGRHRR